MYVSTPYKGMHNDALPSADFVLSSVKSRQEFLSAIQKHTELVRNTYFSPTDKLTSKSVRKDDASSSGDSLSGKSVPIWSPYKDTLALEKVGFLPIISKKNKNDDEVAARRPQSQNSNIPKPRSKHSRLVSASFERTLLARRAGMPATQKRASSSRPKRTGSSVLGVSTPVEGWSAEKALAEELMTPCSTYAITNINFKIPSREAQLSNAKPVLKSDGNSQPAREESEARKQARSVHTPKLIASSESIESSPMSGNAIRKLSATLSRPSSSREQTPVLASQARYWVRETSSVSSSSISSASKTKPSKLSGEDTQSGCLSSPNSVFKTRGKPPSLRRTVTRREKPKAQAVDKSVARFQESSVSDSEQSDETPPTPSPRNLNKPKVFDHFYSIGHRKTVSIPAQGKQEGGNIGRLGHSNDPAALGFTSTDLPLAPEKIKRCVRFSSELSSVKEFVSWEPVTPELVTAYLKSHCMTSMPTYIM